MPINVHRLRKMSRILVFNPEQETEVVSSIGVPRDTQGVGPSIAAKDFPMGFGPVEEIREFVGTHEYLRTLFQRESSPAPPASGERGRQLPKLDILSNKSLAVKKVVSYAIKLERLVFSDFR